MWHWPLLAFFRYSYGEPNLISGSALFILTFLLAWLTYTFIEQTFRYSKSNFSQVFFKQLVLPTTILVVFSIAFIAGNGYLLKSTQYEVLLRNVEQKIISPNRYEYVCQKMELDNKEVNKESCIIGNAVNKEPPQILLWGDSNAAHYIGILGEFANQTNTPFRNFSHAACPPIIKDPKGIVLDKTLEKCRKSLEVAFKEIPKYKYLIVGASHTSYMERSDTYFEVFKSMILNFVEEGKEIVLLGKAPVFENFDRKCMQKSLSIPFTDCNSLKGPITKAIAQVNTKLKHLAKNHQNIHYFDVNHILCNQNDCSPYKKDNQVLYFDSSHIEMGASWKIGKEIILTQGIPTELKFLFTE